MRASHLIIVAAVALAACNKDESAANGVSTDQGLTANDIVANDATAIDAATNDAANMAEDVNYTLEETNNSADEEANRGAESNSD